MSTENRVFSRLFKENKHAAQLRAVERRSDKIKKLNLSAVQTILDNVEDFREAEYNTLYFADELSFELLERIANFKQEIGEIVDNLVINSNMVHVQDLANTILDAIMDIEDKTEELGIEPDDIVDLPMEYGSVNELKARALAAADTLYDDAYDRYQEIRREMESGLGDFWGR